LIAGRPTRQQIEASPDLHTLLIPWIGLPPETRLLMSEFPHIAVHNLHHNSVTTAETALMLMLSAAKQNNPIEQKFRQHDWRPRYESNPALMLHGKTVLILGYGHIGRHVGQVCRALGMRVLAVRRSGRKLADDPAQAEIFTPDALPDLLPQANFLVITLPQTVETEGMIGETELNILPDQAILVNVGRAAVVDQRALYQALESGKLHSAGIDVWYNYPKDEDSRANTPPADYPFHTLENIVMSPHRGGGSLEVEVLRLESIAAILNAAARGEVIPNRIDLDKGY
jgi:phosphoglycerate dehydrogenase-like enzyme